MLVLTIDVKTISSVWLYNLMMLMFILRGAFSRLFSKHQLAPPVFICTDCTWMWMTSYKIQFEITTNIFFLKSQKFLVFLFFFSQYNDFIYTSKINQTKKSNSFLFFWWKVSCYAKYSLNKNRAVDVCFQRELRHSVKVNTNCSF